MLPDVSLTVPSQEMVESSVLPYADRLHGSQRGTSELSRSPQNETSARLSRTCRRNKSKMLHELAFLDLRDTAFLMRLDAGLNSTPSKIIVIRRLCVKTGSSDLLSPFDIVCEFNRKNDISQNYSGRYPLSCRENCDHFRLVRYKL